jgi:(E)-4-hydroxy-3-methylbut-2-enyl-diphosphate synthase
VNIERKITRPIRVGNVAIGNLAGISVQTMTNTNTEDVDATLTQIQDAVAAKADIVRVSCNTQKSTEALKEIVKSAGVPIIADIHFNHKRAIEAIENGTHCIRINPSNITEHGLIEIVRCAVANSAPIRLGLNSGSIERGILDRYKEPCADALVDSALLNIQKLENMNFSNFKISVKSSNVKTTIEAYRKLSVRSDYPLHVGVTEAGTILSGTIKSSIGIGALLADGIGDTIRVSLSTKDLREEVRVGRQILKSLGLLRNSIDIVSCPTCARTLIDVISIARDLEGATENTEKKLTVSVLGCVVNGIGEALNSDIGIFGFEKGVAKIYTNGKEVATIKEQEIVKFVTKKIAGL